MSESLFPTTVHPLPSSLISWTPPPYPTTPPAYIHHVSNTPPQTKRRWIQGQPIMVITKSVVPVAGRRWWPLVGVVVLRVVLLRVRPLLLLVVWVVVVRRRRRCGRRGRGGGGVGRSRRERHARHKCAARLHHLTEEGRGGREGREVGSGGSQVTRGQLLYSIAVTSGHRQCSLVLPYASIDFGQSELWMTFKEAQQLSQSCRARHARSMSPRLKKIRQGFTTAVYDRLLA